MLALSLPAEWRKRCQLSVPPVSRLAELDASRLRGGLGPRPVLLLLAVEDPWAEAGFLNAFLVVAEYRAGYTVRGLPRPGEAGTPAERGGGVAPIPSDCPLHCLPR